MKKLLLSFFLVSNLVFAVTANKVWRIAPGATIGSWGPVNLSDQTNAVTGQLGLANLPSFNYVTSDMTGGYTTTSTSYVDLTNNSVTITTHGRPVWIGFAPDSVTQVLSYIQVYNTASGNAAAIYFKIIKDTSTTVCEFTPIQQANIATSGNNMTGQTGLPIGCIDFAPTAASHTYKIQTKVGGSNQTGSISARVVAYEM